MQTRENQQEFLLNELRTLLHPQAITIDSFIRMRDADLFYAHMAEIFEEDIITVITLDTIVSVRDVIHVLIDD